MTPLRIRVTAALGLLAMLAHAPVTTLHAGGESYRWVDENGNIHYGDSLPPAARSGSHSRLNASGQVIETFDTTLRTVNEVAEEQATDDSANQAERDRILLRSFATERDIIMTRDDRLAGLDIQITLIERRLNHLEQRLANTDDAEQEAGLNDRITTQQHALEHHHDRREALETRFNTDLERFRELHE